jgi:hypothetical protein
LISADSTIEAGWDDLAAQCVPVEAAVPAVGGN